MNSKTETWAQTAVRRARYDNQDNAQTPAAGLVKGHGERIRIILTQETIRRENVRHDDTRGLSLRTGRFIPLHQRDRLGHSKPRPGPEPTRLRVQSPGRRHKLDQGMVRTAARLVLSGGVTRTGQNVSPNSNSETPSPGGTVDELLLVDKIALLKRETALVIAPYNTHPT